MMRYFPVLMAFVLTACATQTAQDPAPVRLPGNTVGISAEIYQTELSQAAISLENGESFADEVIAHLNRRLTAQADQGALNITVEKAVITQTAATAPRPLEKLIGPEEVRRYDAALELRVDYARTPDVLIQEIARLRSESFITVSESLTLAEKEAKRNQLIRTIIAKADSDLIRLLEKQSIIIGSR